MGIELPAFVPRPHRQVIERIISRISEDDRFVGIGIGGSYLDKAMDMYSDIDLLLVVEPNHYTEVMSERKSLADKYGKILSNFTGEHVGEPRLLICLYAEPLMHVDLMFTNLDDLIGKPFSHEILWERDKRITSAVQPQSSKHKPIAPQWVEDRFWVWIHYLAVKIGRGELFETLDGLAFIRSRVFGPLIVSRLGKQSFGVRRIERLAPEYSDRLGQCVAGHDSAECLAAVRACIDLYQSFRGDFGDVVLRSEAEAAAMDYLSEIERRLL
jgi:predicted nucleotidyltransferase